MPLNPTISTQPTNYSPVFGDLWFQLQSSSYSVANYKYVFDLYKINPVTSVQSQLGRYKVPPAPDTYGLFNPARILQTQMTYDLQPTITGAAAAAKSITDYKINTGFEWQPNYRFANTFNSATYLGLTFSFIHDLQVNDTIVISKDDRTTNFEYNGTTTITAIVSSYSVRTAKAYQATLVNAEQGTITTQLRMTGSSSTLSTFNGVRQYVNEGLNYGTSSTYLITGQVPYGSTFSLTNYRFCNATPTYTGSKVVELNDYETLSYLIDNSAGLINQIQLQLYDANLNVTNTFTASYSLNSIYKRIDLGTGPMNLKALFGSGVFNTNPLYYTVCLTATDPTKRFGIYSYKIKDNDPRANCSPYPKIRLCWLNQLGGFDYYTFNFKSKNSINVSKTEFKRELAWNYTVGERQDYVLATKANEMWQISSDFITENESNWVKEMLQSPEVYMLNVNGTSVQKLPIIITDTAYEVKTYLTDKLFALTVNFKYAYPLRSQQS